MSASAFATQSTGFYRTNRANPCPTCGRYGWCTVTRDGGSNNCRHVMTGGRMRLDRDGTEFAVHVIGSDFRERYQNAGPTHTSNAPRAGVDTLDASYCALLSNLVLSNDHTAALVARGLSVETIRRNAYRTMPLEGRSRVAASVVERIGESDAAGIPGLYVREDSGRTWWTLAGSPGLLVPVRDLEGRIVALKVRRDDATDGGPRYLFLSSSKHGGPGAANAVHVPLGSRDRAAVRVTEGELKADVASELDSAALTISVPGVASWALALPVLAAMGAQRVLVAFDADYRTNPAVAYAMHRLVSAVADAGYSVGLQTWEPSLGKGIDEVLLARSAS